MRSMVDVEVWGLGVELWTLTRERENSGDWEKWGHNKSAPTAFSICRQAMCWPLLAHDMGHRPNSVLGTLTSRVMAVPSSSSSASSSIV